MNDTENLAPLFFRLSPHERLGAAGPAVQLRADSSYIIAASPRTGSSLLCERLTATGIAGRPTEPFTRENYLRFCRLWKLPPNAGFSSFLQAVVRNGTTANGIFGAKIHWSQFSCLAADLEPAGADAANFRNVLLACKFIHIRRRDRRAQAISLYRALATNNFWQVDGVANPAATGVEPEFDLGAIRRLEFQIGVEQRAWQMFFAEHGLAPLVIEYEDLCNDYRFEISRALGYLGLNPSLAGSLPQPRLKRQADEKSQLWIRWLDAEDAAWTAPRRRTVDRSATAASAPQADC